MTCAIEGCSRPVYVKKSGWCSVHYNRNIRKGSPTAPNTRAVGAPEDRFWSRVEKTETCWLWTGATVGRNHYGLFTVGKDAYVAHRWAYEHAVGPIPDGLQVDHLCRNVLCVRPEHLEPVTQAENLRRQFEAAGSIGRLCTVPDCDRPYRSTGFCNLHLVRFRRGQLTN